MIQDEELLLCSMKMTHVTILLPCSVRPMIPSSGLPLCDDLFELLQNSHEDLHSIHFSGYIQGSTDMEPVFLTFKPNYDMGACLTIVSYLSLCRNSIAVLDPHLRGMGL